MTSLVQIRQNDPIPPTQRAYATPRSITSKATTAPHDPFNHNWRSNRIRAVYAPLSRISKSSNREKFAHSALQEAFQIEQPAWDETGRRWGHHPRRHSWSLTRTGLFILLGLEKRKGSIRQNCDGITRRTTSCCICNIKLSSITRNCTCAVAGRRCGGLLPGGPK
jgi:hypothetical protein